MEFLNLLREPRIFSSMILKCNNNFSTVTVCVWLIVVCQAVNRSNQRAERLQEALRNIRGNAALLEELLAWLTEAQALLSTKEKDPIPEDLTVVEALAKEHMVSVGLVHCLLKVFLSSISLVVITIKAS